MHRFFDRENFRFSDFSGYIDEQRRRMRSHTSAKNMYNGDMWDKGKGYIGPVPVDNDSNYNTILQNIQRMFTSRNVIQEVVDRQVDGLLSKSPDWKIFDKEALKRDPKAFTIVKAPKSTDLNQGAQSKTDNTSKDKRINEAEMILSEVWLNGGLADALKESLTEMLITGCGILRISILKSFDRDKEQLNHLFDVAKYIKVEHVENSLGKVIDDSGEKLSIVKVIDNSREKVIEFSFINDQGKTLIANIAKNENYSTTLPENYSEEDIDEIIAKLYEVAELSSPMSLNGNITADEIKAKPFVSESMLQNNRALNLDLSLSVGVLVESGYAEMVTTNVALETVEVDDPENPGKKILKPVGIKRGAGIVNNLVGEQTVDENGRVYFEKPGVTFKEPTSIESFSVGEQLYYRQILSEAKQMHVLLNIEADPSGDSRIQSRQDFVKKSERFKPKLDVHGTWSLNTIINLCASALGDDGYFEGIECIFDSKIYVGELSAEEQDAVIARYEHALISRESAMVLLGTEDPILELDLIEADEEEKLALQVRRLEATAKFGNMLENGRPATSEKTKQIQEEKGKTSIRRNRNKKS